jgi:hypothetical protein
VHLATHDPRWRAVGAELLESIEVGLGRVVVPEIEPPTILLVENGL